jgi:RNA recognition motif-containing protein
MMASLNKTNLIVNYLPQNLTDEEFRALFSKFGNVTASKVVRDRATGYSYGFGFIDYATEEEAERAIAGLNGTQLQHKRLKVAFSRQGDNIKGANLYIRNLPRMATVAEVERAYAPYGDIIQTRVLADTSTGESKGVGFVLFSTKEQAERAMIATDGKPLPGHHATASQCEIRRGQQEQNDGFPEFICCGLSRYQHPTVAR